MSFIEFFASVKSRFFSQPNEPDGVRIMNRLRELQEIQPAILKGSKTTDLVPVPLDSPLSVRAESSASSVVSWRSGTHRHLSKASVLPSRARDYLPAEFSSKMRSILYSLRVAKAKIDKP